MLGWPGSLVGNFKLRHFQRAGCQPEEQALRESKI
jgi:hypothetical protein